MKPVIFLAIAALLCARPVGPSEPRIAVFSFDDASCGAWIRSAGKEWERAQYGYWFRGFVSGYNFGNPHNQVELGQMPDRDTLFLYIDKHCREKPLERFDGAAFDLVRQLRDKGTKTSPAASAPASSSPR